MVRCGSKGGYQKDICLEDSGPCAQNMIIILGSVINVIGERRPIGPFYEHENFIALMHKIFIEIIRKMAIVSSWISQPSSINRVYSRRNGHVEKSDCFKTHIPYFDLGSSMPANNMRENTLNLDILVSFIFVTNLKLHIPNFILDQPNYGCTMAWFSPSTHF